MELQKPSGVGGGEAQQPQHETPNNKTLPVDTLTKPPSTLLLPPEEAAQAAGEGVAVGQKETKPSSASEVSSHQATAAGAAAGSDLEKKLRRAERFGMPVQLSEEEKRSSRAERFGTASASLGKADVGKISTGKEEEEKRKARAERFGLTGQSLPDEEAKKKARLERFTPSPKPDSVEEEKRKARAARFSGTANASPETNGKPKAEQKTNAVETKGGD